MNFIFLYTNKSKETESLLKEALLIKNIYSICIFHKTSQLEKFYLKN